MRTPSVTKILGIVLGVAALVVAVPSVTTAQRVEYDLLDALGSARAITDASGDVITRHDYLPYGEAWDPQPSSDTRHFTGKERDSENGLDYFGARYYGTSTAIFTSVDPAMTVDANLVGPQRWNRVCVCPRESSGVCRSGRGNIAPRRHRPRSFLRSEQPYRRGRN